MKAELNSHVIKKFIYLNLNSFGVMPYLHLICLMYAISLFWFHGNCFDEIAGKIG
jgi:hypothetical protein